MNPETDLICLEIVKGIPKAPSDTESAEVDLVILNLLDPNGFSVQTNGWTPAFPGIKRGGTWTESQITDGRTLIAASKDNVTETLNLTIGNADLGQRFQLLQKLDQLLEDARRKWEGSQIEPVYIKFKAACASVHQYALIYNGTVAQDNDPFEESNPWQLTLTLERESAWRMVVPPGGNPLEYWFHSQDKERGKDYTYEDLLLYDNVDHWAWRELDNACEFNGADKTTFLTYPWVDVDAIDIPGDAPALLCTTFSVGQKSINQLYMARSTEPRRRYHRELDDFAYMRNTLNAGDVPSLTVDSCGLLTNDQIVNRYIHQETVLAASTTYANAIQWRVGVGVANPCAPFLLNQMQGEWALYLRCQATSGADGDLEARILISSANSIVDQYEMRTAKVPYQNVVANCIEFDLTYMGRVQLPLNGHVNASGGGVGYDTYNDGWYITVQVRNAVGSDRVFEILDLVFMPITEGFCVVNPDAQADWPFVSAGASVRPGLIVVDNTGYFNHGHTDDTCIYVPDSEGAISSLQLLGTAPTAKPGIDNRFYFLIREYHPSSSQQFSRGVVTPANEEFQVRMNIVPRCYGIAEL
jgi:hypothetical protein